MSTTVDVRNDPEQPQCKDVETACFLTPMRGMPRRTFDLSTADYRHVAACRFGKPRQSSSPKTTWSGDSYRYDIYRKDDVFALRWQNGAGEGWMISADRWEENGEINILRHIASQELEQLRWDLCHALWQAAHGSAAAAAAAERQRMLEAHKDGRIRRRRCHGDSVWYLVESTPDGGTKETYL